MAAQVALAGMDPIDFLTTTDSDRRLAMQAVAARVLSLSQKQDLNRARMIANAIWGAVKK